MNLNPYCWNSEPILISPSDTKPYGWSEKLLNTVKLVKSSFILLIHHSSQINQHWIGNFSTKKAHSFKSSWLQVSASSVHKFLGRSAKLWIPITLTSHRFESHLVSTIPKDNTRIEPFLMIRSHKWFLSDYSKSHKLDYWGFPSSLTKLPIIEHLSMSSPTTTASAVELSSIRLETSERLETIKTTILLFSRNQSNPL